MNTIQSLAAVVEMAEVRFGLSNFSSGLQGSCNFRCSWVRVQKQYPQVIENTVRP
jgi:hypothetical protein